MAKSKKGNYENAVKQIIAVLQENGLLEEVASAVEPEKVNAEPTVGDSAVTNSNYDPENEYNVTITKIKGDKFTVKFEDGATDEIERGDFDLVSPENASNDTPEEPEENADTYTREELDAMTDDEIAEVATVNELTNAPAFIGKGIKKRLSNREEIIAEILGEGTEPEGNNEKGDDDEGFGGGDTPEEDSGIIEPPTVEVLKSKKVKRADIEKVFVSLNISLDKKETMDDMINQCMILSVLSKYDGDISQITDAEKKLITPNAVDTLAEKLGVKPSQKISETLTNIYSALK